MNVLDEDEEELDEDDEVVYETVVDELSLVWLDESPQDVRPQRLKTAAKEKRVFLNFIMFVLSLSFFVEIRWC